MHVHRFTRLEQLAPYAEGWDRLAGGAPLRGWAWQSTWWRHYGPAGDAERHRTHLCVLAVFDRGQELVGLAPWYWEHTATRGRVLRLLGSGEVCSDHLGMPCQAGFEDRVAESVAEWLTTQHARADRAAAEVWDLLELDGVDADDPVVARLVGHLAVCGNTVHCRPGMRCWELELPACWEDYLRMRSKTYRRQVRCANRTLFQSGRAVLHSAQTISEVRRAMDILIDLHQRRWHSLGKPGCFASRRFTEFHRDVAEQLFRAGHLQLHWLEVDGRPAAAEYHLSGGGVLYAYQSGLNPDLLRIAPGRLVTTALLRWAIEAGYRRYDFLRGDEPYKARWGAAPRRALRIHVVPHRASARLRHRLWLAGNATRQWVKSGLMRTGSYGGWK